MASRIGTGPWTCVGYDARGRVLTKAIPASATEPAVTYTTNHAVGSNPQASSTTCSPSATNACPTGASTTQVEVDLLGRTKAYTDAWAHTSAYRYDQAGRLDQLTGPTGVGTHATTFDAANGRITAQVRDSTTLATPTYNTGTGEIDAVDYANGTRLILTRNPHTGRATGMDWTKAGAAITSDRVEHSPGGKIIDAAVDGVIGGAGDPNPAGPNYGYDGAGRLAWAYAGTITYRYGHGGDGGCGPVGTATNRTWSAAANTTSSICVDPADRLTSATDTTIGSQTLGYDGADRHVSTVTGTTNLRYVRDGTDRIIARLLAGATTARYGHTGPGDTPDFATDTNGAITETYTALLGGALATHRGSTQVWSHPNIHGDIAATTDAAGTKAGNTHTYDPYGQPQGANPDNATGNHDWGWLGQHQRGLEHEGGIHTIEMGARQYHPGLGRFLQVDPVEGGVDNDYVYPHDPINEFDLDGQVKCQACANFASGVLDSVTFGAGEPIERALGIHGKVRHDSAWRSRGQFSGLLVPGGGAAAAGAKAAKRAGLVVYRSKHVIMGAQTVRKGAGLHRAGHGLQRHISTYRIRPNGKHRNTGHYTWWVRRL